MRIRFTQPEKLQYDDRNGCDEIGERAECNDAGPEIPTFKIPGFPTPGACWTFCQLMNFASLLVAMFALRRVETADRQLANTACPLGRARKWMGVEEFDPLCGF